MLKAILFLLPNLLTNDANNLEQKACDYFFDNIFRQEYKEYTVIEFKNYTDTSYYWGIVYQCQEWDDETKRKIVSTKPGQSIKVKVNMSNIRVKNITKNSKRLKVNIYSSLKVGDYYFVCISTYRKLRFVNYYFIKFNSVGTIIETCATGEII